VKRIWTLKNQKKYGKTQHSFFCLFCTLSKFLNNTKKLKDDDELKKRSFFKKSFFDNFFSEEKDVFDATEKGIFVFKKKKKKHIFFLN
jgi:hypothetical protein